MRQLFIRDGGKAFFAVFVLCCLLNIYNLSNFEISVDDELFSAGGMPLAWRMFGLGRWGAGLVFVLFSQPPVVPFSTSLLFCFSLAVVILICSEIHGIRKPGIVLALTPVFVLFPTWAAMESFECILPSISLGLILTSISAYLSRQVLASGSLRPWWRVVVIILLLSFAIGCYQSFALLYLVIGVSSVLLAAFRRCRVGGCPERSLRIQLGLFFGFGVGASLVSVAMARVFQSILSIEPLHYLDSFLNLDAMKPEFWLANLGNGFEEMAGYYGGSAGVYGYGFVGLLSLVSISLALLIWRGVRCGAIGLVLLTLMLVSLPFSFSFLGGNLPARSLFALPYVVWFFALILVESIQVPRTPRAMKLMVVCCLSVVMLQSLALNGAYSAASELVNLHDRTMASQIYERLVEVDPGLDRKQPILIGFRGRPDYSTPYAVGKTSTLGSSIFDWGGGKPYRMAAYMRLLGYSNIWPMEKSEIKAHSKLLEPLPAWPAAGSLIRIGPNRFLVNLGEAPHWRWRRS